MARRAENAGAGRGEAGDRLKNRVQIGRDLAAQEEGQRAHEGNDDPRQRDHDEAVLGVQGAVGFRTQQAQGEAQRGADGDGIHDGKRGALTAHQPDDQRRRR